MLELAEREVDADGRGRRWLRTQREHWPAPEPTSSTSLAAHVAEHPGLVLGQPLRAPHEAVVAEEGAVGGLVLVGVAVPVGAVGAARLRLVDRAALDPHGPGAMVLHELEASPVSVRRRGSIGTRVASSPAS